MIIMLDFIDHFLNFSKLIYHFFDKKKSYDKSKIEEFEFKINKYLIKAPWVSEMTISYFMHIQFVSLKKIRHKLMI